jgi:drug/metabolite transporter (DMT)-like permease
MLVGMQPILTVFLARSWFGEQTTRKQWLGLLIGLVASTVVVEHKMRLIGSIWSDSPHFSSRFSPSA